MTLTDLLTLGLLLAGWIVLQRVVLPRMGVPS
jgi:hypothetical protein